MNWHEPQWAIAYMSSRNVPEGEDRLLRSLDTPSELQAAIVNWVNQLKPGDTLVLHLPFGNKHTGDGMLGTEDDERQARWWMALADGMNYGRRNQVTVIPYLGYRDAEKIGHPLPPSPYLTGILEYVILDRMAAHYNPRSDYAYRNILAGEGERNSYWLGSVCVTGDKLLHDYAVHLRNGSTKLNELRMGSAFYPVIVLGKGAPIDGVAYGPPGRRERFDLGAKKPHYEHCLDIGGEWANICVPLPALLRERARAAT